MAYEVLNISNNLKLSQLDVSDANLFFELIDKNREYLAKFLPWPNETKSVNNSVEFIEQTIKLRQNGEEYGFGIIYKNQIVGHISLMHIKNGQAEIGYWIGAQYSGQGIMMIVVIALTKFAHDTLKLKDVIVLANPENIGSNKVAEKSGYELNSVTVSESGEKMNRWVSSR